MRKINFSQEMIVFQSKSLIFLVDSQRFCFIIPKSTNKIYVIFQLFSSADDLFYFPNWLERKICSNVFFFAIHCRIESSVTNLIAINTNLHWSSRNWVRRPGHQYRCVSKSKTNDPLYNVHREKPADTQSKHNAALERVEESSQ